MLSTHTIHWNPTCSRVICITLIASMVFLILSFLFLLHLIGQIYSRLCQLLAVLLEGVQCLLLLLKFTLMLLAHIALVLQLNFERMDPLQCLMQ